MVSIVIVNYNTAKFIKTCIQSIEMHAPKDTEVVVVDNNSTDGSVKEIQKLKIKIIRNKENLGYAKAVNQGIEAARGDYIFVLNPDAKLREGAVDVLLKFTQAHKDAGVVGPRLLNPDGSIQASCYHEQTIFNAVKEYFLGIKGVFEKYAPSGNGPTQVDAVVGAAMFIPRRIIERVGNFNENYFMYFEDLDFCRKVRDAGFTVYYLPFAQVMHEHGGVTRTVGEKAREWLVQSSKIYHGILGHLALAMILWLGQKGRRLIGKTKYRVS